MNDDGHEHMFGYAGTISMCRYCEVTEREYQLEVKLKEKDEYFLRLLEQVINSECLCGGESYDDGCMPCLIWYKTNQALKQIKENKQ